MPSVKLYVTTGSPYARMARMMVLEKGLGKRVEIVLAQTRSDDSPYYRINPSGRVPYLVCDDGVGLEESSLICAYLDQLDGEPQFQLPADGRWLEARRLEGFARSMIDGVSVWNREMTRPADERSPGIILHEKARAQRMADLWQREIGHPLLRGAFNMIQLTLLCCLGLEARNAEFRWREGRPQLEDWFRRVSARASFAATAPSLAV
jgi:glutathione S-transferase